MIQEIKNAMSQNNQVARWKLLLEKVHTHARMQANYCMGAKLNLQVAY